MPYLFRNGKFGYKLEREFKLSPIKYFNQKLFNFTQMFAPDPDHVFFFSLPVTQQIKLQSEINITLEKVCTGCVTAGILSNNFSDTVKSFIANDEAYPFMNTIKGTPVYNILPMVKQLGIPAFFIILNRVYLHWNELISIIAKSKRKNLHEEHINEIKYFEQYD